MTVPSVRERFSQLISSDQNDPSVIFDEKDYLKLLSTPPSPSLIIQIISGLSSKKISSDLLLKYSIRVTTTEKHLIIAGLSIRYGANVNGYYDTSDGKMHILGYVYVVMSEREPSVLKYITLLLKLTGADPTKDLFTSGGGGDVGSWLAQKYPHNYINSSMEVKDKMKLSLLLDQHQQILENVVDEKYVMDSIEAHAIKISGQFSNRILYPNVAADLSVKYLNVYSFEQCLEMGYIPIYPLINNILVYLKYYNDRNNSSGYLEMMKILKLSLEKGSKLDSNQITFLRSISEKDTDNIISEQRHPIWIVDESDPDNKMKTLANSVGIDPMLNRKDLLDNITKAIDTEPFSFQKMVYMNKLREKNRTTIDADMISTLSDKDVPVSPTNLHITSDKLIKDHEASHYLDIFWHTDINGHKWLFTSHLFDSIRESNANPYTGLDFSKSEMAILSQQRNTIKRLGLITSDQNNDVEDLSIDKNNSVIDNNTEEIMKAFSLLATLHGVDPTHIELVSIKYLERILSALSENFPTIPRDLGHLDRKHAIITFNRMCLTVIRSYPRYSVMIFESIKTALSKRVS
jgi:hypothetical protein